MNRRSNRWLIIAAAATALEADALRNSKKDGTLSYATREAFRTDRPSGKLAFAAAWTALYVWYLWHIVDGDNV